jgi:outer membrane protein OmpA-like peptidoglycan-associated protein
MKRFLNSTAALSVAVMNIQPWPLVAQTLTDVGTVIAADGTVLCEPTADLACDPTNADLILQAEKIEEEIAKAAAAEADAKAKDEADAAAAEADAKAKAEADAAAAEADAKAKAEADAVAAEADAKAKAEADAAAAEADAKAKAEADAAAAEADAKAKAEAEAAAAEADAKAKAEADAAAAEADAKAKAEAEAAAAEADANAKAEADAAAAEADAKAKAEAEAAAAEADAKAKAEADAAAAEADAKAKENAATAADPAAEAPAQDTEKLATETENPTAADLEVKDDGTIIDPSAGLKTAEEVIDPTAVPVTAPEVSEEEIKSLSNLLAPEATVTTTEDAPETAQPLASVESGAKPVDAAPSSDAVTATSETLTEESTRRATEEFAAAPQVVAPGKKNKLSDLEKAGLVVLGALAVGTILNSNKQASSTEQQQVVSNTGDRVVVLQPDGSYQIYKDDDALMRRPGNTLRTETFKDGSTRTFIDRPDGSQIVTIRNATGRVLQRVHYDAQGNERFLINDLEPERPIVVSNLPKPRNRPIVISTQDGDAALRAALSKRQIESIGRTFSLRQVRDIPQVRHLAAMIDVDNITFASGSSALSTSEINALSDLGTTMQNILDANPNEVFLIEGHTDAVGKAAMNLALSDRRAETVALALTEYFGIPPENMVVQGYGEGELLIDTQADEKRNRRAAVRIITPLL